MAVVVNELLQNAVEHALPPGRSDEALRVEIAMQRGVGWLKVTVRDNGVGLPAGFAIEQTSSLGLSIVRGLVTSQMKGRIEMTSEGGTIVGVSVPVTEADDDAGGI